MLRIFCFTPLHLGIQIFSVIAQICLVQPVLISPTSSQIILLLIQYYLSTLSTFHISESDSIYASPLSESFSPINTLILSHGRLLFIVQVSA